MRGPRGLVPKRLVPNRKGLHKNRIAGLNAPGEKRTSIPELGRWSRINQLEQRAHTFLHLPNTSRSHLTAFAPEHKPRRVPRLMPLTTRALSATPSAGKG